MNLFKSKYVQTKNLWSEIAQPNKISHLNYGIVL